MEVLTALLYVFIIFIIYTLIDYIKRIPKLRKLDEKYILVTGCDSGFGYRITHRLDKLGCHVFAACLTEEGETRLKKTCSLRIKPLYMDVTKVDTINKAFDTVSQIVPQNTGLWGVLNNAGIMCSICPDEWFSLDDYRKVSDVNLFGLIAVTKIFLPLVKKGRQGRIVNTSSICGIASFPGITPYTISKFGVEAFSDSIRRQLNAYNISVHIIEPGGFNTGLIDTEKNGKEVKERFNQLPSEVKDEYGREYVDKYVQHLQKIMKVSDNVDKVVDAYEHALFGKYPRLRYPVGLDSQLLIPLFNIIPHSLFDTICNLTRVKLCGRAHNAAET